MKLLHIDSSITGAGSASRQLSEALVVALKAAIPGLGVVRRDLDANPIPHLDSKRLPTVRSANALNGPCPSMSSRRETASSFAPSSGRANEDIAPILETGPTLMQIEWARNLNHQFCCLPSGNSHGDRR